MAAIFPAGYSNNFPYFDLAEPYITIHNIDDYLNRKTITEWKVMNNRDMYEEKRLTIMLDIVVDNWKSKIKPSKDQLMHSENTYVKYDKEWLVCISVYNDEQIIGKEIDNIYENLIMSNDRWIAPFYIPKCLKTCFYLPLIES